MTYLGPPLETTDLTTPVGNIATFHGSSKCPFVILRVCGWCTFIPFHVNGEETLIKVESLLISNHANLQENMLKFDKNRDR